MVYSSILLTLWAGLFAAAGIAVGVLFMRRRYTYLQRKEADAQMALEKAAVLHSQQLALMNSIDDLAWLKDAESRFLFVNRKFGQVFGRDCQSLVGKTDYDLSAPEMAAHYQAHDRLVLDTKQIQRVEELITLENGSMGWSETIKVPVFDAHGEIVGTAGVARDITERKLFQQRMEHLARHDPLTGLANRLYLEEQFEQFIQTHPEFSVLFLDLDNFKLINDTDGHSIGDELLRAVAQRLLVALRPGDVLVRLGGDEFLILMLQSQDGAKVEAYAQRLVSAICIPFLVANNQYTISASIGIARFPLHGTDRLTLIKHADLAMYQAKKEGRNRFSWFRGELASQTVERRQMEMRLRQAIENNDFILYYQPVIETKTGRIIGAEALIRMLDKEKGIIPPVQFIPLAEETGLIETIGNWVLRAGMKQMQDWRMRGLPEIQLSINISGIQFLQENFAHQLSYLLEEYQLPGAAIELEITEGILMSDTVASMDILTAIKKLGVALAIDDFGTGYSSLSYLKHLPIDRLKIDRSFVDDLPSHAGDIAITRSILHLAAAFQLQVTAEGVEMNSQFEFLRDLGCEAVQGYLFSRPVPAQDFEKLLIASWQDQTITPQI